jgi:hypothetical protein
MSIAQSRISLGDELARQRVCEVRLLDLSELPLGMALRMCLEYGVIDRRLTPDGESVFLGVNPRLRRRW